MSVIDYRCCETRRPCWFEWSTAGPVGVTMTQGTEQGFWLPSPTSCTPASWSKCNIVYISLPCLTWMPTLGSKWNQQYLLIQKQITEIVIFTFSVLFDWCWLKKLLAITNEIKYCSIVVIVLYFLVIFSLLNFYYREKESGSFLRLIYQFVLDISTIICKTYTQ